MVGKQVCELVRAPLSAADVDTIVSTLCTSLGSALDGAPPNRERGSAEFIFVVSLRRCAPCVSSAAAPMLRS